jgi:hypothetical protein
VEFQLNRALVLVILVVNNPPGNRHCALVENELELKKIASTSGSKGKEIFVKFLLMCFMSNLAIAVRFKDYQNTKKTSVYNRFRAFWVSSHSLQNAYRISGFLSFIDQEFVAFHQMNEKKIQEHTCFELW